MTNSGWLAGDHCSSSDNDLRLRRLNSSSDDLRANAAVGRPSPMSPHEGRGQAVKAKEPEVCPRLAPTVSSAEKPSPAATTSAPTTAATCPPTPHNKRRPPQSALAGPHSRSRHENENGTILEHECRPRDVRRVVRPPGAADHGHPDGGQNAAPWPGSISSPSLTWLEDASSIELEDGFLPRMPEEEAGRQPTWRQAPARLALLPNKDDEDP
jgi:hypothetical protein